MQRLLPWHLLSGAIVEMQLMDSALFTTFVLESMRQSGEKMWLSFFCCASCRKAIIFLSNLAGEWKHTFMGVWVLVSTHETSALPSPWFFLNSSLAITTNCCLFSSGFSRIALKIVRYRDKTCFCRPDSCFCCPDMYTLTFRPYFHKRKVECPCFFDRQTDSDLDSDSDFEVQQKSGGRSLGAGYRESPGPRQACCVSTDRYFSARSFRLHRPFLFFHTAILHRQYIALALSPVSHPIGYLHAEPRIGNCPHIEPPSSIQWNAWPLQQWYLK